VVGGGLAYVGGDEGVVYAVDILTGRAVWAEATGNRVQGTPALDRHLLYVPNGDLLRYDAGSGLPTSMPTDDQNRLSTAVTLAGELAYAGGIRGTEGFVDARDPIVGSLRWRVPMRGAVVGAPAVAVGAVYAGALDGELVALAAADGAERWRITTRGSIYAAPAADDGVVYAAGWFSPSYEVFATGTGGLLYAVDAATGATRWEIPLDMPVNSSPAVADGTVVVGGGRHVVAVDQATGRDRWRYPTGGNVDSSPAVCNGVAYVGSQDGHLYALDLATGAERWRVNLHDSVACSPAVLGGVVYVTAGGGLFAIAGS